MNQHQAAVAVVHRHLLEALGEAYGVLPPYPKRAEMAEQVCTDMAEWLRDSFRAEVAS